MTSKQKFSALVSKEQTPTLDNIKERIKNREMLRESQEIALKILEKLDELKWSQKNLARVMLVSPQQVNKIVRGKENLTLETQIKIQRILDIPILASYYEKKEQKGEMTLHFKDENIPFVPEKNSFNGEYINSSDKPSFAKMNYDKASNEYTYEIAC